MGDKLDLKRKFKENALLDAAFELFTKTDVNETTIDDIVKKAGVAKGTFYLYFKDKYDIIEKIVIKKTMVILKMAIEATEGRQFESNSDRVIYFIGFIIDYLSQDKLMMRIIHKNLSYGLYRKVIDDPARGGELRKIVSEFEQTISENTYSRTDIGILLFILLEMTGSVCYSSIINNEPASINEIKPVLLKTIRKIVS